MAHSRTGTGTLYRAHLASVAKAAGIPGKIGWHTFRDTFATLLKANGEDVKTVQEGCRTIPTAPSR
jgi:site-specific recombinase XerD